VGSSKITEHRSPKQIEGKQNRFKYCKLSKCGTQIQNEHMLWEKVTIDLLDRVVTILQLQKEFFAKAIKL
jgi:hypothetical protein